MLSRSRIARSLVVTAVIIASAAIPTAAPALAATTTANCAAQNDVYTFTPALKTTPAQGTVSFTGASTNAGTCTTPEGEYVVLQSATGSGPNMSCSANIGVTGTLVLTWTDNGGHTTPAPNSSSTVTLTELGISSASKAVTLTGTVTGGRFSGGNFRLTYASTANTSLCQTAQGLKNIPGPGQLVISVD